MKTIQLFIFTCVAACAYAQDWQYQYLQPFNAPSEFNPALTGVMRSNARVAVSSLVENRTFSTYYNYSQYASSSNKLTFDMPIALDTSGSFIGVGVSVGGYFHNIPYSEYIINQPEFKLNEMPCKLQSRVRSAGAI